MNLTTVKEASKIILENSEYFGVEEIDFLQSSGRILKEVIVADRDFPPFNRVSMDGIAISSLAFNKGIRSFKIEGVQAAGSPQLTLENTENCIEAMTGAVLPKNTDVVIQYELLTIKNGVATVNLETVKEFQNVHLKGFDRKKGAQLIPENTLISAAEISVFATVGKLKVTVAKQPKVMIVSTGNELVEVGEIPETYQIRRSNVYALVALLEKLNIKTDTAHILDDKEVLKTTIEHYLTAYDVLLFSGAVSKGKFDFIPEVLAELGVEKLFHQVKQRPGKPFWFGVQKPVTERSRSDKFNTEISATFNHHTKTVFAFPGNPVSTFVSCIKFFTPWYYKSIGLELPKSEAILIEDFEFKPNLTYFLQVKLHREKGSLYATPISGKGSGDLANLVDADAFLELPDDRSAFFKGEVFPTLLYRNI